MNHVVRGAGMVRLLLKRVLQNSRGLHLLGIGLILRLRVLGQGQRIKDLSLEINRILVRQPFHGCLIIMGPDVLVHRVCVFVEFGNGRKIIVFALCLDAGGNPLLYRRCSLPQHVRSTMSGKWILPLAQSDTPVGDGTVRIIFQDTIKGIDRCRKLK